MQSGLAKAGSSFRNSAKQDYRNPTLHDVYSVNEVKKHYLWCLGNVQKRLKNLAFSFTDLGLEKPKKVQYQAVTSYDVFADYQANLHNQAGGESTLEILGLAFCFGASILLICFSVFVVF